MKERGKTVRERGNMTSFFDPSLTQRLERPYTAAARALNNENDGKKKIVAHLINGQLRVNRKQVKEESIATFQDAWFLNNDNNVNMIRHKSIELFDIEPIPRPRTAAAALPRSGNSVFGSSDSPTMHSSGGPTRSINRYHRPAPSDNYTDPYDIQINSKSKTILIKPKDLDNVHVAPQRERTIQRQVRALGSIVSARKTFSRMKQEKPNAISADYVLFMECMKKNILPHATGKLDIHTVHTMNTKPAGQDEAMLADTKIVTIADLKLGSLEDDDSDDASQQSVLSYKDELVTVEHSAIIELSLGYRGLGPDRGICLSEALAYCPALQRINLCSNRLNDFACVRILTALFAHTACTELDISENELGSLSMSTLVSNISSGYCTLQSLNVSRSGLTEELSANLAESLLNNTSVQKLQAASCGIGVQDANISMIWCDLLEKNATITHLDLSNNFMRRQLAITMFSKISTNTSLKTLNMSYNQLTDLEACFCALYLEQNASLTTLDLSSNMCSSKACIALSFAAAQPTCSLQFLNLNGSIVSELAVLYSLQCMHEVACQVHVQEDRILHIACNGTLKSDDDINFNPLQLTGKHDLDLSNPFDRIIAKMCLKEADRNPNSKINFVKWLNPLFNTYEHISLARPSNTGSNSDGLIIKVVSAMIKLSKSSEQFSIQSAMLLTDLRKLIGIQITTDLLLYVQSKMRLISFDPEAISVLECYTLLLYWIYEFMAGKGSTLDVYGIAKNANIVDLYDKTLFTQDDAETIKLHAHKIISELHVNDIQNKLTYAQAEQVLAYLHKSNISYHTDNVEKLFLQMCNSLNRRQFLTRNLYFVEILQMRKKLGALFNVLVGNPTGHYMLDLADALHRRTFFALASLHELELDILQQTNLVPAFNGSQAGDQVYFRNPSYNGKFIRIDAAFISNLPKVGKLRFDFVSTSRLASVMPTPGFIGELDALSRTAHSHGQSDWELMCDIVFSSTYTRQLRNFIHQNKAPKNFSLFSIELSQKALLLLFGKSKNQEELEDYEDPEDDYTLEETEQDDSNRPPSFSHSVSSSSLLAAPTPELRKPPSMMRLLSQTMVSSQSLTQPRKRNASQDRVHRAFVAQCVDLWQDSVCTSYERYKQAHCEVLQGIAEGMYREMLKSMGSSIPRSIDANTTFPAQVYAHASYTAVRSKPVFTSISFVSKRRNAVVKQMATTAPQAPTSENAAGAGTRRSANMQRASMRNSLNAPAPAAPADDLHSVQALGNKCCVFEGMLLNLEVLLLHNVYLTCSQVKKLLEGLVVRGAPVYVLARAVCIIFAHVVDVQQLANVVQAACGSKVHVECVHRLGAVNYCSAESYGLKLELDLATPEHSVVAANILAQARMNKVKVVNVSYRESLLQEPSTMDMTRYVTNPSLVLPKFGLMAVQFARTSEEDNDADGDADGDADTLQKSLPYRYLSSVRPVFK
eukprot:gene30523-36887_t